MSGIIEKYAQTPVMIRKRVGIVDGKPEREEFGDLAIIFDFSQRDLDYLGDVKNGMIFLVSPTISQSPAGFTFHKKDFRDFVAYLRTGGRRSSSVDVDE